uniref:Uncharacterized protein n=1 Tax=Ralstonia solanacearum CFBP2957 TaxID=859656 RepID=D8P373_RALSL|nr:protein of unknown function [Ralstonia solanacearum CFBP2957]
MGYCANGQTDWPYKTRVGRRSTGSAGYDDERGRAGSNGESAVTKANKLRTSCSASLCASSAACRTLGANRSEGSR